MPLLVSFPYRLGTARRRTIGGRDKRLKSAIKVVESAVFTQRIYVFSAEHRTASGRDYAAGLGACLSYRLALEAAKTALSLLPEYLARCHAGSLGYHCVGVDELSPELLCKCAADGSLSAAGHADEHYIFFFCEKCGIYSLGNAILRRLSGEQLGGGDRLAYKHIKTALGGDAA